MVSAPAAGVSDGFGAIVDVEIGRYLRINGIKPL
jgi:hypothetical protein